MSEPNTVVPAWARPMAVRARHIYLKLREGRKVSNREVRWLQDYITAFGTVPVPKPQTKKHGGKA